MTNPPHSAPRPSGELLDGRRPSAEPSPRLDRTSTASRLGQRSRSPGADHHHDAFPRWVRIVLYFVGWLLILVGIAALFLPGPGLLGLALGAAVLSVVSEALHDRVRKVLLRVWPEGAEHLDRFRHKVEDVVKRLPGAGRT